MQSLEQLKSQAFWCILATILVLIPVEDTLQLIDVPRMPFINVISRWVRYVWKIEAPSDHDLIRGNIHVLWHMMRDGGVSHRIVCALLTHGFVHGTEGHTVISMSLSGKMKSHLPTKKVAGIFRELSHSRRGAKKLGAHCQYVHSSPKQKHGWILYPYLSAYLIKPLRFFMYTRLCPRLKKVASSNPPGMSPIFSLLSIMLFITSALIPWISDH